MCQAKVFFLDAKYYKILKIKFPANFHPGEADKVRIAVFGTLRLILTPINLNPFCFFGRKHIHTWKGYIIVIVVANLV